MLRISLLAIAIFVAATACHSKDEPATPATAVLHKIKRLIDAGTLDYAAAREFLGVLLSASKFEAIASGDKITSPVRASISSRKMPTIHRDCLVSASTWRGKRKAIGRPRRAGIEKGLKSSLRISFDQKKICITRELLKNELGSGKEGGFFDSDATPIAYGDTDKLLVSFTFEQPDCADA